jgi:sterol desaturase/sphingolipid hydroxylase (fatty acid hydroxylase superfamily)
MKLGQGRLRRLFSLQHSRAAYLADFALLYAAVSGLAAFLVGTDRPERRGGVAAFVVIGLGSWTLIEYAVHRFLFHGLQPFRRWHALHHRRQTDLIYVPTTVSVSAVTGLALLSGWMLGELSRACALTLGVLIGYVAYSITHHAVHHWSGRNVWLRRRKRWHSLHHRPGQPPGRYGVTSAFWDHVFHSTAHREDIAREIHDDADPIDPVSSGACAAEVPAVPAEKTRERRNCLRAIRSATGILRGRLGATSACVGRGSELAIHLSSEE